MPLVPFPALAAACDSFSAARKIGVGATGEVFSGVFQGEEVAIKRLHLPAGAPPAAAAAFVRAFAAELRTLSEYRHARLVRLIRYAADEAPGARARLCARL